MILPVLTLHDRAGGAKFTELTNAELEGLDLSPLAATGRALLLGRPSQPLSALAVDAGTGPPVAAGPADAYLRVVLPVRRGAGEETEEAPAPPAGPFEIRDDLTPPRPPIDR